MAPTLKSLDERAALRRERQGNITCRILDEIDRLRDESGMSVAELAERSGIIYQQTASILTGYQPVGLDRLQRLCDVVGIEIATRPKG